MGLSFRFLKNTTQTWSSFFFFFCNNYQNKILTFEYIQHYTVPTNLSMPTVLLFMML